ncbi:phosphoribosyltransferase [Benzoatithermus flavus]|uniref:Phosphoribosyltransferase n=1 Tax=Benzoatithermus flavus TaxID=3108223 RepID=A0ABU8XQ16_9PROT
MMFADRRDAGQRLGQHLQELGLADPLVLALPRGGVAVGLEVAKALGAPLDVVLVRKIGAPWHKELAAGAVVDGDQPELVLNNDVVRGYGIDESYLEDEMARQLEEIERRRRLYLGGRQRPRITGRTAIVVDDGIATGATVRAALHAVRRAGPRELVLAVPVASPEVLDRLAADADRIVCLHPDPDLMAVGQYYRDFRQVEDEEVVAMLEEAARHQGPESA